MPQYVLNNTITNNTIEAPAGGLSWGAGLNLDPGGNGSIEVINNIIVGNYGQSSQGLEIANVNWGGGSERINVSNNLFDFSLGFGENDLLAILSSRIHSVNFELQATSMVVDAGIKFYPTTTQRQ